MLALVEVGCPGELRGVRVTVAIGAVLEPELVKRVFALGNVTLPALQSGMLAFQWICSRGVLLETEFGRSEAIRGVAGCAFPCISPLRKLPSVRIGLVAICALLEG